MSLYDDLPWVILLLGVWFLDFETGCQDVVQGDLKLAVI